jgi:hypothetical protein
MAHNSHILIRYDQKSLGNDVSWHIAAPPSYLSLSRTGLYAESHGIVANVGTDLQEWLLFVIDCCILL